MSVDAVFHFVMSVDEFGDHHLFVSRDRKLCETEERLVRGEHPRVASSWVSMVSCGDGLGSGAVDLKAFKAECVDRQGCYRMSCTDDPWRFADYCGLMAARGGIAVPVRRPETAGMGPTWLRRVRSWASLWRRGLSRLP